MSSLVVFSSLNDQEIVEHCGHLQVFTFRLSGDLFSQYPRSLPLGKSIKITCPHCGLEFTVKLEKWCECDMTVKFGDLGFPALSGVAKNTLVAALPDMTKQVLKHRVAEIQFKINELKKEQQAMQAYLGV